METEDDDQSEATKRMAKANLRCPRDFKLPGAINRLFQSVGFGPSRVLIRRVSSSCNHISILPKHL